MSRITVLVSFVKLNCEIKMILFNVVSGRFTIADNSHMVIR